MNKLVVVAALILVGCSVPATSSQSVEFHVRGNDIYVVEDHKRGVICYVLDGYHAGGISCFPFKPQ